jgi:hypothetical protein
MGQMKSESKTLYGNAEGKRPLGRLRRRWQNCTRMDLKEAGF